MITKSTHLKYEIRILFMLSFILSLFGCSSKANSEKNSNSIYPSETFSVLEATLKDGTKIVGSINMSYKNYDKKAQYPWCLTISIGLDTMNLFENGLPKEAESKIANELEDELVNKIKAITTAHYIGHIFNRRFLDIYIYLPEPEAANKFLQSQVNKPGLKRGFAFKIEKDQKWETVSAFLIQ